MRMPMGGFLKIDMVRKRTVYDETASGSEPGARFYLMVGVSTLIACFGLVADSTAVVIGAMLVAPLMTPIFGISLALVRGDSDLFKNAVQAEVVGVSSAIAMGFLVGMLLSLGNPYIDATTEMLSRTKPNLFDLIVAVLAGFAGTYALIDEKISPALPGVAIATAIVPPLANCGLCLAFGAYQGALGSFLLFFANFLSILIIAAVLFFKAGMRQELGAVRHSSILRRFGWAAVCFLLIAAFLANALFQMVQQRHLYNIAKLVLSSEFAEYPATGIEQILLEKRNNKLFILAEMHSPSQVTPNQVSEIEEALEEKSGIPTELIVRITKTSDVSSSGSNSIVTSQRLDGFFVSNVGNPVVNKIRLAEQAIREYLDDHIGLDLLDVDYLKLENRQAIMAMISGVRELSQAEISEMETNLRQRTDDADLDLRTDDADLDLMVRFVQVELYDKYGPHRVGWTTAISPTDAQENMAESLRRTIRMEFTDDTPHLLEKIHTTITEEAYIFLLEISGPAPYTQADRKRLQELLASLTDQPVTLHVWVNHGAVLTDQGLVPFAQLTERHLRSLGDSYQERLEKLLKSAR
jgi:uncharacterized hydrophobic protein (TIGR00271 family)